MRHPMHIYISFGIRVLMDTYSLSIYSIIGERVTSSPEIQSTRAFLHFVSLSSLLCVCFFHLVFASCPPPNFFPFLNLLFGALISSQQIPTFLGLQEYRVVLCFILNFHLSFRQGLGVSFLYIWELGGLLVQNPKPPHGENSLESCKVWPKNKMIFCFCVLTLRICFFWVSF